MRHRAHHRCAAMLLTLAAGTAGAAQTVPGPGMPVAVEVTASTDAACLSRPLVLDRFVADRLRAHGLEVDAGSPLRLSLNASARPVGDHCRLTLLSALTYRPEGTGATELGALNIERNGVRPELATTVFSNWGGIAADTAAEILDAVAAKGGLLSMGEMMGIVGPASARAAE